MAGLLPAAWQCDSPHFQVISESDFAAAREAATHLERVREQFEQLHLAAPSKSGRIAVFLFADKGSLRPYLAAKDARDPSTVGGLALRGEDRDWIAVVWDPRTNPRASLAHEYAHLIRDENVPQLWFREGFSEYLSTVTESDGSIGAGPTAQRHLEALTGVAWLPWKDVIEAGVMSPAFGAPTFYAQAWLAVAWVASQGIAIDAMSAANFSMLLAKLSESEIQAELESFWRSLSQAGAHARNPVEKVDADASPFEVREAATWVLPFWRAEFHRESQHWQEAQSALEALETEFPERPEPTESLGAIALSLGDYQMAEEKLRTAMLKGTANPLAHHRYSLMLLRPFEVVDLPLLHERAARAVWHARMARTANPQDPRFVLGEAQAWAVAGQWESAARRLSELRAIPGWQDRADVEFDELTRRRAQALREVDLPLLQNTAGPVAMAGWMGPKLSAVPRPAAVPKPPLQWPPPGTVLLYGYINGVECRDREKLIRVKTPRYTIELLEKAGHPAKLYNPPKRLNGLQCGMSGFEVNVVYRPLSGTGAKGELVAVVF